MVSWTVGTGWARWRTAGHAVSGFVLAMLAPAELLDSVRSFEVRSATGDRRVFPINDAARVCLAVGHGGRLLRTGPPRGARPSGPWWVKWVVALEATDRTWWLLLPFPPA